MAEYSVIVQPADSSGDHWLIAGGASHADRFAKWVHKTTGAAVVVHDQRNDRDRIKLGDFDDSKT